MPDPAPGESPNRSGARDWLTTLGWAAYLACSWTWCIGMFLPVLLVRDFGIWGFVAFAIPNVIGAAAMGWVVRSPEASAALLQRHYTACVAFSFVTIAFQNFFFFLLLRSGVFGPGAIWLCAVPIGAAIAGSGRGKARLAGAGAMLAFSLGAFVAYLSRGDPAVVPSVLARPDEVMWLAPVCAFGFGLCPYLDLTFHRARRARSGAAGPIAFSIGFGAFFLIMILFSLAYSSWIAGVLTTGRIDLSGPRMLVLAHIVGQLVYTVVLHLGESAQPPPGSPSGAGSRGGALAVILGAILLALAVMGIATAASERAAGFSAAEIGYRLLMAFYALIFPAYVWLCMIPTRDGHSGPSRAKVVVWIASVAVAAPMFWMGFIDRRTWWLAPGLGVVLVARLFLPRAGSGAATPAG